MIYFLILISLNFCISNSWHGTLLVLCMSMLHMTIFIKRFRSYYGRRELSHKLQWKVRVQKSGSQCRQKNFCPTLSFMGHLTMSEDIDWVTAHSRGRKLFLSCTGLMTQTELNICNIQDTLPLLKAQLANPQALFWPPGFTERNRTTRPWDIRIALSHGSLSIMQRNIQYQRLHTSRKIIS